MAKPFVKLGKRTGVDFNSHLKSSLSLSSGNRELYAGNIETINKDGKEEDSEKTKDDHKAILDLKLRRFNILNEDTLEYKQRAKSSESCKKSVEDGTANQNKIATAFSISKGNIANKASALSAKAKKKTKTIQNLKNIRKNTSEQLVRRSERLKNKFNNINR